MPASFVQRSLRMIAMFEAYYSDLPLERWLRVVKEGKAEPEKLVVPVATMGQPGTPTVEEELPELTELFLEAERRRFPFFDTLTEIGMKDLAQQCAEISRQLRDRAKG